LVGSKKLLWGTDMPGLLTAGTYPQLLYQMDTHLAKLSRAQRQAVLGLNALRAYPF
jgi:predicted TIM-barrel fold metal-dependent hydrolase